MQFFRKCQQRNCSLMRKFLDFYKFIITKILTEINRDFFVLKRFFQSFLQLFPQSYHPFFGAAFFAFFFTCFGSFSFIHKINTAEIATTIARLTIQVIVFQLTAAS